MIITDEELNDLIDGKLDLDRVRELQSAPKQDDRRNRMIALHHQRVPFDDPIVLPLQENLFIVEAAEGKVVRCGVCGHEFGSYLRNWKESALVYERDPQDGEVYPPANAPTKEWMVAREYYCPGCATLLDTEGVPQGYPFIFNFLPYFEDEEDGRG